MRETDWTIWIALAGLFVTIIGSSILLAFKIGGINEKIMWMEKPLEDLPRMRTDLTEMQVKIDVLWRIHLSKSRSPIVLNNDGLKVLEASKMGSFASQRYPEILSNLKESKPDNAYQAQELLISMMSRYKKADEYRALLQDAAFYCGYDVESLLFVAALSIRDKVVADLGFQ